MGKNKSNKNYKIKETRRKQKIDFTIDLAGRHVFGAYFNMARTNFIKTINHILPIAGVRGNYAENQINKMLKALYLIQSNRSNELTQEQLQWKRKLILNPEQQTCLKKLLYKHFPVLKPMMADKAEHRAYKNKKKSVVITEDESFELLRGISLADCLEIIALMAETLTECRNTYTHRKPYNTPSQWAMQYQHQETLAIKLDKVITACRRVLKDREALSVNELEFLTGIDHMEQVNVLDDNGNIKKENGKTLKVFKEYDDFYFKISGERIVRNITLQNGSAFDTMLPALSDFGLLFFCVLFLSKPYAKLFMDEARLFEFSPFNDKENIIMQEMLSIYRIRPPKQHRIDSRDNKDTLTMDIFGELGRCPIELYELLDKNSGQTFFHDKVKRPNSHTPEISKRLRYNDRFPHLALRYIDEKNIFSRIRFQLQLGVFRYKFYEKECIDGRVRVRRIQKEINGYGHLLETEAKRYEKWGDLMQKREEREVKLEHEELYIDLDQFTHDTAESTPYITDRRATYNIHANRIGLFWEESQNPNNFDLFDSDLTYLPELTLNKNNKTIVKMPAPRSTLSVRDLPAMLFYEHLRNKNTTELKSAETIIIETEENYRNFFDDVANGKIKPFKNISDFQKQLTEKYPNIQIADIPEKIRMYLTGKGYSHNNQRETVRQRMIRLAQEHLEERERRVQRRLDRYKEDCKKIGDKTNKIGKKDFVDVRHGALARYLVQSMMEWQPSNDGKGQDKLTGLNYNVLTAYLATYGTRQPIEEGFIPRTLQQVLFEAHLSGSANPHPFINKVLSKNNKNIEDLYLNYLSEELKHIVSRKQSLMSNPNEALSTLPFLHHERARYKERTETEVRSLAKRYTTIQLPDGLFTKHIVKLLRTQYADNTELQNKLDENNMEHNNPLNNAAYLITLFYHMVLNDDAQPFYHSDKIYTKNIEEGKKISYSFKRAYELLSILHNNKKSEFPYELIPYYLTCDEIQKRISDKQVNHFGDPISRIGKRGKSLVDSQGNTMWQRIIAQEINDYVDGLTDKELKISFNQSKNKQEEERQEKQNALISRLNRQLKEIKNNERKLRRYKTQDMVLFLLAKDMFNDILTEQNAEVNWDNMRLNKVCDKNFLRQTLTFQVPVTIGDKTIYVEQENMSIKNYGEFYRFLTDDRLDSLLKNIVDTLKPNEKGKLVIRHTDLMSELALYDQQRATIFKMIQKIEKIIFDKNPTLRKPDLPEFWVKEGLPKRNNFASLLEMIDQIGETTLSEEERTLLITIRNAFSHNSYNIDLTKIHGVKKLPEVAKSILMHLSAILEK